MLYGCDSPQMQRLARILEMRAEKQRRAKRKRMQERKQRLQRSIRLRHEMLVARDGGFGFIMVLIALAWLYIAWTDAWPFADQSGALTMALLFASPFALKRIRKRTLSFLYTMHTS